MLGMRKKHIGKNRFSINIDRWRWRFMRKKSCCYLLPKLMTFVRKHQHTSSRRKQSQKQNWALFKIIFVLLFFNIIFYWKKKTLFLVQIPRSLNIVCVSWIASRYLKYLPMLYFDKDFQVLDNDQDTLILNAVTTANINVFPITWTHLIKNSIIALINTVNKIF